LLVAVDADHRVPGARQDLRGSPAELSARADHDRYPLAHDATSCTRMIAKSSDISCLLALLRCWREGVVLPAVAPRIAAS
jgi:hypothetical protein